MQAAQKAESQNAVNGHGAETPASAVEGRGHKVRAMLKVQLGDEVYSSWFKSLEFESFDGRIVKVSVPVKFVRNWIQEHYSEHLLRCSRVEFASVERVEVVWRQPGAVAHRAGEPRSADATHAAAAAPAPVAQTDVSQRPAALRAPMLPVQRTSAGGLEGSPLDPRYTFESFVVGASNRMAHAGATQVAETVLTDASGYNPLYIHSPVGLGKSHLLHAIAWEVKKRAPNAQVLYLTAERFRYQFVEALRSSDPLAFKERFRNINMLLIDDLEFLQGERTEQEFDHIINALLDGGKQVVVASARAPNQIERLNERMRSRLQRGLVTELQPLDHELRLKVLEKRLS
ncbi:MAG TPA: DnaA/Hda family protein, partial [Hyphomicrobium sp.]